MYAIAIIRYRRPLEEVLSIVEQHRSYLRELKDEGVLIASGPMDPRNGGILLLNVDEDGDRGDAQARLDRVRDEDPYVTFGMAQYELIPWAVNIGREELDELVSRVSADSER